MEDMKTETALVQNDDPDALKNKGCKSMYNCLLNTEIPGTAIIYYMHGRGFLQENSRGNLRKPGVQFDGV
jgi:hypothetical protein